MTMDEHGRIVDTLAWAEFYLTEFNMARDGRHYRIRVPFQREVHTAVMPGGGGVIVVREDDSAGPSVVVTRMLPRKQEVVAARGAVMVAVEEDELGRASLVRYRVGRGSE